MKANPASGPERKFDSLPLRIGLAYFAVAGCWIAFSDSILNRLVKDPAVVASLQTWKGLGFVLVTGMLLIFAIRHQLIRRDAQAAVQRATEERMARQRAELIALTGGHQLAAADLSSALRRITESAARTLGVARASVWRLTSGGSAIQCADLYETNPGRHSSGQVLSAGSCPAYFRALRELEIIAADDARNDPRTSEFTRDYLVPLGIGAMLDAPIQVEGARAGVLCHEHVGGTREWTADEKTFAVALANLVALALETDERRRLEEQLRQSQKLEAIGQLAGGVAHDFNNLLAVILMHVELLASPACPAETREGLGEIRSAAERAAELTRQLLLFSRRQVIKLRALDLNDSVTGLVKMLQRIIGEDIHLELHLHPKPLTIRADAGMLDQLLLNLAVNARDAMPHGGRLVIKTAERFVDEAAAAQNPDAAPGSHAWLEVADTGSGIAPEILPRIFEPFFTTKERGKGTGLGLATVFGIVKQHRGWIEVASAVGQGSAFGIFIPSLAGDPDDELPDLPVPRKPRTGGETILLAEDDPAVREVTRATLARHGYTVLEACNGPEALRLAQEHGNGIALLLTDLVMPGGLSGHQLARRLAVERPRLRVVYTSGYSSEIAGRALELREGEQFVQKPCPPERLLESVRRALEA